MENGLRRVLHPIVSDNHQAINPPGVCDYKWGVSAVWYPQERESSYPAHIAAFTCYKDIPQPRRYDIPPLEWPSNHDMDLRKGLLRVERHYSGARVWVRYMQFFEKQCSKCGASFWPSRCPACGSDQWTNSAWLLIQAVHPSLEHLATLNLSTFRVGHIPVR